MDKQEQSKELTELEGLLKAIVLNEMAPGTELNTAEYALDALASRNNPFLEYLHNCMKDMNAGEPNREITLGNTGNMLHIAKVDDGCYSGWVKNDSQDVILRLEKMPIPSIVQALEAKQLIEIAAPEEPKPTPELEKESIAASKNPIKEAIGERVIEMLEEKEELLPAKAEEKEESLEREELVEILEALNNFRDREVHIHIHKADLNAIAKALGKPSGHPVGTIKEHEGKKYRKLGEGHWVEHAREDADEKAGRAVEETKKQIEQEQLAEQVAEHAKTLEELKERADKLVEQRAKERGKEIKDTPAKLKKDVKKAEKESKELNERAPQKEV